MPNQLSNVQKIDKKYIQKFYFDIQNLIITLCGSINIEFIKNDDFLYTDILKVIFRCIIIRYSLNANLLRIENKELNSFNIYNKGYAFFSNNLKNSVLFPQKKSIGPIETNANLKIIMNVIDEHVESEKFNIKSLGALFEELFSKNIQYLQGEINITNTNDRKDSGVFFTDLKIINFIITEVLRPHLLKSPDELLQLRFIDPAMGSGYFIFELIKQLSKILIAKTNYSLKKAKRLISLNCIFGVDKNSLVVDIAKICIWLDIADDTIPLTFLDKKLKVGDSLLKSFNYSNLCIDNFGNSNEVEFSWLQDFRDVFINSDGKLKNNPGFDGVIGNPPWGKIKSNIKDYFSINEYIVDLQGKDLKLYVDTNHKDVWQKYKEHIKEYSNKIKQLGIYKYQSHMINGKSTGGDIDLYKFFLELSYFILKKDGKLGFLIPSSFYLSQSATGLRHLYFTNGKVEYLINFINKKKIFPIHPSFKFLILIYQKGDIKGIERAVFNLEDTASLDNLDKFVKYNTGFLKKYSKDLLTIPEVFNQREIKLIEKMNSLFPLLGEKLLSSWNISFKREIDMTQDSAAFYTKDELLSINGVKKGNFIQVNKKKYIPVYEGRMVHQYDYAYKEYISGHGRTAKWSILGLNNKAIKPHYYIDEMYNFESHAQFSRAAFCDITGQHNVRTVLATLIPSGCICGNKVPTCNFDTNDIRLHLFWIGIANSFVVDWLIRKRMTTTLNFFHWEQIPFPRINVDSDIAKSIILRVARLLVLKSEDVSFLKRDLEKYYSLDDLSLLDSALSFWDRGQIRAEIEYFSAKLYNINIEELALILFSFPSLDKTQPTLEGDTCYRNLIKKCSYVTRDLVLFNYLNSNGDNSSTNINSLYKSIGIDISASTGPENICDRIQLYKEIGAKPFYYL